MDGFPVTGPHQLSPSTRTKQGRPGAWDKEKGEPSVAFKAAEQLLACDAQMRERYERAKQRATSSIEPKTTKDALYIYPKLLLETLREELLRNQSCGSRWGDVKAKFARLCAEGYEECVL